MSENRYGKKWSGRLRIWLVLLCMSAASSVFAAQEAAGAAGNRSASAGGSGRSAAAEQADENAMSVSQAVLAVGQTLQLKVEGLPKSSAKKEDSGTVVRWTSSKPAVAAVSEQGAVKALAPGKTTVKAKFSGKTLRCTVLVRKPVSKDSLIKAQKGAWKNQYGGRYYVLKDGSMAVGSRTIGSAVYVFDQNGALQRPKKKSLVQIGKARYCVNTEGKAIAGWHVIGGKLYHMDSKGLAAASTTVEGITLQEDGSAKAGTLTTYQTRVSTVVDAIVTDRMTKSQKLKACWNYLTSKRRFKYASKYPNRNETNWQRKCAYNMLLSRSGNCYGFACAFAAMAHTVGYTNAAVVCGRVSGSRDHARDGLTRHAWVRISGYNFDPEGQFAGWYRGCYWSGGYRIRHTVQKTLQYA